MRMFDPIRLARLMETPSKLGCECPNQVARIVETLVAFEEYSRRCESAGPEEAALHAMLARQTSAARLIMEDALLALVEFEKIAI
jgi:hypothetical protein